MNIYCRVKFVYIWVWVFFLQVLQPGPLYLVTLICWFDSSTMNVFYTSSPVRFVLVHWPMLNNDLTGTLKANEPQVEHPWWVTVAVGVVKSKEQREISCTITEEHSWQTRPGSAPFWYVMQIQWMLTLLLYRGTVSEFCKKNMCRFPRQHSRCTALTCSRVPPVDLPMMPSAEHSAAPCWSPPSRCPRSPARLRSGRPSTDGSSPTRSASTWRAGPSWHWGPGSPSDTRGRSTARPCRCRTETPSGCGWRWRDSTSLSCRGSTGSPRGLPTPPARLDTSVRRTTSRSESGWDPESLRKKKKVWRRLVTSQILSQRVISPPLPSLCGSECVCVCEQKNLNFRVWNTQVDTPTGRNCHLSKR